MTLDENMGGDADFNNSHNWTTDVPALMTDPEENALNIGLWSLIDGILFIAIVSGNLLTITAILRRRLVASNLFVLSLACSDLSVGLVLPYHMAFYIDPRMGRDFHHCIIRLSLVSLACIASMFNILGIAADRFLAIVFPLHYQKIMTIRVSKSLICTGWLAAVAVSTAPVYWHRRDWSNRCELGAVVEPLYVLAIHVPAYTVLFATMCGFYARILCEARRHVRQMRKSQGKNDSTDNWKSIQVLVMVMGSFTLSYTPFFIILILSGAMTSNWASPVVYKITNSLAMANSAVNPIIYTWKNHEFKQEMGHLVTCQGCRAEISATATRQTPTIESPAIANPTIPSTTTI